MNGNNFVIEFFRINTQQSMMSFNFRKCKQQFGSERVGKS